MGGARSQRALYYVLVLSAVFIVTSLLFIQTTQAITASYGHPYQGHLENGVVFPSQFPGYHLRDPNRSYTTPEVVGALLDAIEAVRTQFPDTCDVFLGDFTIQGGGSAVHHRSHQNGRDVDVGLYAKGNRALNTFMPMGEGNLDAAKTWCLMENLISSQRVQYIFLDRSVQKVLYEYALSRGYDKTYLDRVFGNVRGSLVQHIKNHVDHMHVRFFTPWSTLAAHIGADEVEKQAVIEVAQQSYLPRKVNYYVSGSEKGLDELARSFGVASSDLCRWNHLSQSSVLVPGSCLVFYKRSFESEPVLLARSLQPGFIAQATPPVRMASLQPEPALSQISDSTSSPPDDEPVAKTIKTGTETIHAGAGKAVTKDTHKQGAASSSICFASDSKKPGSPTAAYYAVNNGGTLKDVSKRTGIPLSSLCQLNGLGRNAHLKHGQRIKLTQANLPVRPTLGKAACSIKDSGKKRAAVKPDKKSTTRPEAKSVKLPVAKSATPKAAAEKKAKSAAKKPNSPAPTAAAGKGNRKAAVYAKTAMAVKPAVKQTGKPGKPAPASVQKKTPGSKVKAKTAAVPGKNTTLAKK